MHDRHRKAKADSLKERAQEPQIGTFRLKVNRSHTRFEGLERSHPVTYYGNGHPKAPLGGSLIRFTVRELRSFKNPRARFELIDGDWHDEADKFDPEAEDAVSPPSKIDLLLVHNVDDIEKALAVKDAFTKRDLKAILDQEFGEFGKSRKGVREAVETVMDIL